MNFKERYIEHLESKAGIEGKLPLLCQEEDFSGKDFADLDLRGAAFFGCNFTGANFSRCDLRGTDFTGSDLTDADLSFSIMTKCVLDGATLLNNKLCETIGNGQQVKSLQIGKVTVTYSHDKRYYDCLEFDITALNTFPDEVVDAMHPAALRWHQKWSSIVSNIMIEAPAKKS